MRIASATLLCLALSGCAHRALITSEPPGASVYVGKQLIGPAPQEVHFWWYPFRPMKVKVSAPGYRAVTVKIGRELSFWYFTRQLFGLRFKQMVGLTIGSKREVVLIRNHGPSGTWSSEDIKP